MPIYIILFSFCHLIYQKCLFPIKSTIIHLQKHVVAYTNNSHGTTPMSGPKTVYL